jgi:glycerol-1-phosphate dehydrogenase [NAD(P)+]
LFDQTGFWSEIQSDPFSLAEWKEALRLAPTIKDDFFTILSEDGALAEAGKIMENDAWLRGCFVGE